MIKLNQNGDTIVEVLLSLAVLSMVIGASYSISSRSLIRAQQAQERLQATRLAEGQVDRLKYLAEKIDPTELNTLTAVGGLGANGKCLLAYNPDPLVRTVPIVSYDTGQCVDGSGTFNYRLSSYASGKFTIQVTWTAFRSSSPENVTMLYKVQAL